MEEKDEFSDIALEKDTGSNPAKYKRFALIGGVLVLIFIVVLFIVKIMNKQQTSTDDSRLIVQKKHQANKQETNKQANKDNPAFKQVPIIQEESKKDSFEDMVKKLKEKESKFEEEKNKKSTDNVEIAEIPVTMVKPDKDTSKKQATKKVVTKKEKSPLKPVKIIKKPKKVAKKPVEKVEKKKTKTQKSSGGIPSGTYVQVSATTKSTVDQSFMANLKAKKYPYQLYTTNVKGRTYLKVLVGPYSSKGSAREALVKIKKDLNPKAFIFNIK